MTGTGSQTWEYGSIGGLVILAPLTILLSIGCSPIGLPSSVIRLDMSDLVVLTVELPAPLSNNPTRKSTHWFVVGSVTLMPRLRVYVSHFLAGVV